MISDLCFVSKLQDYTSSFIDNTYEYESCVIKVKNDYSKYTFDDNKCICIIIDCNKKDGLYYASKCNVYFEYNNGIYNINIVLRKIKGKYKIHKIASFKDYDKTKQRHMNIVTTFTNDILNEVIHDIEYTIHKSAHIIEYYSNEDDLLSHTTIDLNGNDYKYLKRYIAYPNNKKEHREFYVFANDVNIFDGLDYFDYGSQSYSTYITVLNTNSETYNILPNIQTEYISKMYRYINDKKYNECIRHNKKLRELYKEYINKLKEEREIHKRKIDKYSNKLKDINTYISIQLQSNEEVKH